MAPRPPAPRSRLVTWGAVLAGFSALALVLGFAVALAVRGAALLYGLSLPSYRPRG